MEINLKELKSQPVLYIKTRTSLNKLPKVIGESYMKIVNYMQSLGEQPTGLPYTAYYNLDMQDMDVEMGFPVSKSMISACSWRFLHCSAVAMMRPSR